MGGDCWRNADASPLILTTLFAKAFFDDSLCFSIQDTDCPDLYDPLNGQVTVSGFTLDAVANYSCDEGYILNGDAQRICLGNRTWSGTEPTCESEQTVPCPYIYICTCR